MKNFLTTTLLLSVCLFPMAGQIDLEDGLQAYYSFDGNADDESLNGYDGFVNGAVLSNDCLDNEESSYYFDGIDDYIEILDNDVLDFEMGQSFAISLNFRADSITNNETSADLISKWTSAHLDTAYSYGVRILSQHSETPGRINIARYDSDDFGCNGITKFVSEDSYLDGHWHSLVFQGNSSGVLSIFIDGIHLGSYMDESLCSLVSQSNLIFGARGYAGNVINKPFKGNIDEIRIYDRELSLEEVDILNSCNESSSLQNLITTDLLIYPNPTNGIIKIVNFENFKIRQIEIYDLMGKKVFESNLTEFELEADTGVYFMHIALLGQKTTIRRKIIKI